MSEAPIVLHELMSDVALLAEGAVGIDAGLTLTKVARRTSQAIELTACETAALIDGDGAGAASLVGASAAGVTGARGDRVAELRGAVHIQEIEAASCGAIALLGDAPPQFVLALLGTGTAFAAVRDGRVSHLGGTAMGGGSFSAIARRVAPALSYSEIVASAARGDRRNADLMVSDAYPDGIGRIGGAMTAAHLAKGAGSLDDVLAALLNMHGENIAQIAAGRALVSGIREVVIAGGFAHANDALVTSMDAMLSLFGVRVHVTPHAGFAGAIGAALMASGQQQEQAR